MDHASGHPSPDANHEVAGGQLTALSLNPCRSRGLLLTFFAIAVVDLPLLGVAEDLVGVANLRELLARLLIPRVLVCCSRGIGGRGREPGSRVASERSPDRTYQGGALGRACGRPA